MKQLLAYLLSTTYVKSRSKSVTWADHIISCQTQNFVKVSIRILKNPLDDLCLYYFSDKISNGFDPGIITGMILIELQKAFDTIDHKILL